jgi:undecaprenyl-diphosphatase
LEYLQLLDIKILLFINGMNNQFLDGFMYYVSQVWSWIPLYMLLAYLLYKQFGKRSIIIIIMALLVITICDQVASNLIKNAVQRLRPSHEPMLNGFLHYVRNYRGGPFGFVSSHAANSFGLAAFIFNFFERKQKWASYLLIFVSCLISYSRIYLGVHYPSDVIAGAIVGILIGISFYFIYNKFVRKYQQ